MITRLKYGDETIFAGHLGRALAEIIPADWLDAQIVPVPLHPRRLAERGYNQAALLAVAMGRQACLKVSTGQLSRVRQTQAQARLDRRQRAQNLRDAFCVSGLSRSRIILVDDVVTTGHTVDACARVLLAADNDVVGVLCCALARFEPTDESHS
jgi:ComF family protein